MKMIIINVCIRNLLYALNNSYMYFLFMLKFEYFDIKVLLRNRLTVPTCSFAR